MIKSMDLAWISTNDFERSKKFFTEIVGLKLTSYTEGYEWMELSGHEGGALLGVAKCDDSHALLKAGNNAVMSMTVTNIEETKLALEAHDVKFVGDIIEVPGHVKIAFFTDPDNNLFQLVQDLSGKR